MNKEDTLRALLRIGTTGDYPPVSSYDASTGEFSGQDVALIRDFARDQGYALEFVLTRWPSLMQDLLAGQFEIAVGGISRTQQRETLALTSQPIGFTGKVALVRGGEESKYCSLAAIDTAETTVVEDRGGTNEQFARAHIKRAKLTILPDNEAPFASLLDRRADVMFTDSVEALYRQQTTPGLRAVRPEQPYTRVKKIFLFRKDQKALRDQFDNWLVTHGRSAADIHEPTG
ncbi:MAG: transporter substrate-binding domain-containing protein [Xanthobacteraceae bacterium]